MRPRSPSIFVCVFMFGFGLMLFLVGIVALLLRQFRFESAADGYKVVTPQDRPVFFGVCLLVSLGLGSLALSSAVAELRRWRQIRKRNQ